MPAPFSQLSYNGYPFAPASTWFTIDRRGIIGPTGRRNAVAELWHIRGRIPGANTAEVTANMAAMEAAIVDGGDLVFSIYHNLLSAATSEGTHVFGGVNWLPGYEAPRGSGAELVNRREFAITIGGKIVLETDTDLYSFRESYMGIGTGGPIIIPATSLYGGVQAQQTTLYTPFTAIQEGEAIYYTDYGPAATPLWISTPGVYYYPNQVMSGVRAPLQFGINQNLLFSSRWSYRCWSTTALVGTPVIPF